MARDDIDKMISDALAAMPGAKPLPHAQHILDQYAKLCAEDGPAMTPSPGVALPIVQAEPPSGTASTTPRRRLATQALARLRRRR